MITTLAQLELLKSALLYKDQFLNNSASPYSFPTPSPITLPLVKSYSNSDIFFLLFKSAIFSNGCPTTNSEFQEKNPLFKAKEAHLEFKT